VDANRGVEIWTAQTEVEANARVIDVARREEQLPHADITGALDAPLKVGLMVLFAVVLPDKALVRHVCSNVEDGVALLPVRHHRVHVEDRLRRFFLLLLLLPLLLFLILFGLAPVSIRVVTFV